MTKTAGEHLRSASLVVSQDTFHVISVTHEDWKQMLGKPDLSPVMSSEFLIFKDRWEITLVVDDSDFRRMRPGLGNARSESGFRLLSFDVEMDFDVIGFMAEVSGILAEAGISILPFSSYKRDHILVRQDDLAASLKAFRDKIEDIC